MAEQEVRKKQARRLLYFSNPWNFQGEVFQTLENASETLALLYSSEKLSLPFL